jgi:hypothetical protein
MAALPATFASLGITDVRDRLSVVASSPAGCRRARNAPVASATLHYNGPPVGVFGRPQAELYHVIAIDTPNHQARIGADSLQYHLVVLSDGSIYQTRDLTYQAWHCANQQGNETSLAVHLPLGGLQDATDAQWRSTWPCLMPLLWLTISQVVALSKRTANGAQRPVPARVCCLASKRGELMCRISLASIAFARMWLSPTFEKAPPAHSPSRSEVKRCSIQGIR